MIRLATKEDINQIMHIYDRAREYMISQNNPTQWGYGYPYLSTIEEDISLQRLYVGDVDNNIHYVFYFHIGADETYANIENGTWLNNEEYGVIHRIASDGLVKNVFLNVLNFCKSKINNIRIDTHNDNKTMQYILSKNNFTYCGIIYVRDDSPRLAYQYSKKISIKSFTSLPDDSKNLRIDIFMKEQGFIDEFDDLDEISTHLVLYEDNLPVATCRYYFNEQKKMYAIGRIAVNKEYRHRNYGSMIINEAESQIKKLKQTSVCLSAQVRAKKFYENNNYVTSSEIYDEEGVLHVWMYKQLV